MENIIKYEKTVIQITKFVDFYNQITANVDIVFHHIFEVNLNKNNTAQSLGLIVLSFEKENSIYLFSEKLWQSQTVIPTVIASRKVLAEESLRKRFRVAKHRLKQGVIECESTLNIDRLILGQGLLGE